MCVCVCVHAQSLQSCLTPCEAVDCSPPGSMGFSRQEYWSEFPCPSPGDLPDLGIEPTSLTSPALADRFFSTPVVGNPTWRGGVTISNGLLYQLIL